MDVADSDFAPPPPPQAVPRTDEGPCPFIPLRRGELVASLLAKYPFTTAQRGRFGELCRLLEATLHHEYHEQLVRLKDLYAPLDPDDEWRIHGVTPDTAATSQKDADAFFDALLGLLQAANYRRLPQQRLEEALCEASRWGLNLDVNLAGFQRLEVFYRGKRIDRREVRDLQSLFLKEQVDTEIFERLLVAFRGGDGGQEHPDHDPGAVYIKFFKLVPVMDVDMLLPGAGIRMTKLDQGKIIVPTISGIGLTLFKLMKLTIVWTMYGMFALLALIVGAIGYGVKSFLGYLRTKEKYQFLLTRSLYYKNLDNNAGAVLRLLDLAEEQEFREAVLGYVLLWREAPAEGWSEAQIDRAAEQHLLDVTGREVDFDVHDALAKLVRLGLVSRQGQQYVAHSLDACIEALDHAWDSFFHGCSPPTGPTSETRPTPAD